MKNYLLDTNILVHKVRNSEVWKGISKNNFPKGVKNYGFISQVTTGELWALAYENRWGADKNQKVKETLKQVQAIPISLEDVIISYVNISAYSQNRHKSLRLPRQFSARNMGKNDLWIAATAAALDYPLITTDRDFEHLDKVFIELIYIDTAQFLPPAHV